MKTLLQGKPYVHSSKTDIRKTFRRLERERKAQAERDAAVKSEQAAKVAPIKVA